MRKNNNIVKRIEKKQLEHEFGLQDEGKVLGSGSLNTKSSRDLTK
ncbi:hypothetical protein [Bacillus xiapuensis]|nr:hypothetical protein [Bacillus xiapuensis]